MAPKFCGIPWHDSQPLFRGSKKGIRKKEGKTEKERGSRERKGARQSRKEEMGGTKGENKNMGAKEA